MPENTEIPLTGDPRVDAALQRIRGKFRDLEDALLVQVYMEKDLSTQMQTLAGQMQTLARQMKALAAHTARRDEEQERTQKRLNEMSEQTDQRIAQLVLAIGKLIDQRPPA